MGNLSQKKKWDGIFRADSLLSLGSYVLWGLSIVGGGLVTIFGKIEGLSWTVVAVLALAAITFLVQLGEKIFGLLKKPGGAATQDEVKLLTETSIEDAFTMETVRKWLDRFRLTSNIEDQDDAVFALLVSLDTGVKMVIRQPKRLPEYIVLLTKVVYSKEDRPKFDALELQVKAEIATSLRIAVFNTNVESVVEAELKSVSLFKNIPITKDLTEAVLLEKICDVERVTLLVQALLARELYKHTI